MSETSNVATAPANTKEANTEVNIEVPSLNPDQKVGFPTSIERIIDGKPSGLSLPIVWEKIKRKASAFPGLEYPSIDVKPTRESLIAVLDALGAETFHGILKPKLDQRCYGLYATSNAEFNKDTKVVRDWDKEKNIKAIAEFSASTESENELKLELFKLVNELEEQFDENTGKPKDQAKYDVIQGQLFMKKRALKAKLLQKAARKAEKDAAADVDSDNDED